MGERLSSPGDQGGAWAPNVFGCIFGINLHLFECLAKNFLCLFSVKRMWELLGCGNSAFPLGLSFQRLRLQCADIVGRARGRSAAAGPGAWPTLHGEPVRLRDMVTPFYGST